jgi:adenosylhomocysteine nucleosidase
MNYIVTALDAEARPLIEHYRLKRDNALPYTLYRSDDMLLLVSGMGKSNAAMAVSALLGWRVPKRGDILINIGICAAPSTFVIGEALLIHQIIDGDRRYYPDILYPHTLRETSLICTDAPQSIASDDPVDMESAAIFQAASRFFKLHQMAYLKIVSDHFEPDNVTKEGVISLIHSHVMTFDHLRENLIRVQEQNSLFSDEERVIIEMFKTHFTKSQGDILEDTLCYFRLKDFSRPLPLGDFHIPDSKRERSILLEKLIATLTT